MNGLQISFKYKPTLLNLLSEDVSKLQRCRILLSSEELKFLKEKQEGHDGPGVTQMSFPDCVV